MQKVRSCVRMASMYCFCASPLGVIGRCRGVIEHHLVEQVAQVSAGSARRVRRPRM